MTPSPWTRNFRSDVRVDHVDTLPAHRHVLNGRTFDSAWSPSTHAAVEIYVRKTFDRIVDRVYWLLAFALFVAMLTAPQWWPR